MKWEEIFDVRYHDTNANEIVGISNIFKFIQETANFKYFQIYTGNGNAPNEGMQALLSGPC